MKLLKLLVLSAVVLMVTVGASNGAPASVLTAVPGAPGAEYPTNGELLYSYGANQIEFQWTTVGTVGTIYYDLEVSTDPTFADTTKIVFSTDGGHTTSCNYTLPNKTSSVAFNSATTYYWRVQAYDNTCNTAPGQIYVTGGSGWAVYTFYTAISAPTLIGPANGSTLKDNLNNDPSTTPPHPLPLFQWTAVSGASGYVLEVSTTATFSSLYIDASVPTSNTFNGGADIGYSPSADLAAGTLLYWQVETLNSTYGPSAWSTTCVSACSFYTANVSAPPVPIQNGQTQIYKTATGKVTTDFTPGLRWLEVTLPSGATFSTYEVEVSTDKTFTDTNQLCFDVAHVVSYLANQTQNNDPTINYAQLDTQDGLLSYVPDDCPTQLVGGILKFVPATKYFWRVRAYFNGDASVSDWSTVFEFDTSYAKIVAGFTATTDVAHNTITFSWTPPTVKPYSYGLTICYDANFSEGDCIFGQEQLGDPYVWSPKPKQNIAPGATLYWRVQPEGTWGPGLWSDAQTATAP